MTFVLGTAIAPVLTLIFADGLYRDDMSSVEYGPSNLYSLRVVVKMSKLLFQKFDHSANSSTNNKAVGTLPTNPSSG